MGWHANADDAEPDSFISFEPVYDSDDDENLSKNRSFLFDFQVVYNRPPEPDADGYEDIDGFETRTICQTHEFDRDWLIGGDMAQIQASVYQILDMIDVPCYSDIVATLTLKILDLKRLDENDALPKVESIEVGLNIIVSSFPGDDDDDVRLAVAPACEEAVENHLETVVVGNEGYCVICMDKIRVGSSVEAGRLPCMHVFHRTCGENWLRSSGSCPLCRAVFPS